VVVSSVQPRLGSVLTKVSEGATGHRIIIIDTIPLVEYTAKAAEAADLVVVLNMVTSRGNRHNWAMEVAEEMGIPICPVSYGNSVTFEYEITEASSRYPSRGAKPQTRLNKHTPIYVIICRSLFVNTT